VASNVPLDGTGSGNFSIPELVQFAGEGSIRVPTFQRQFAWTSKDVRTLFDSIYRGFPVGTLLLWRQAAEAGTVTLGPITFDVPAHSNAYWVVDGQQRITSLFAALSPTYHSSDDRFDVYFDFETQKFITPRRGATPPRAIPLREALETRTLLQWLRNHGDELASEDLDIADRLAGTIRDYRIPAYIVSGNNPDLLREVFDRVNSAGKPISRAQVFHALFAGTEEPGSPASVVAEIEKLGFGTIDEGRVVQSLLALRGGDVQRDIRDEFDTDDRPADWFDATEVALKRAIEFLRAEGVAHQLLMPNTLPFPVLAAFFHLHPEPEPWNRRLLARWLWRGWVHGFGREGGQTPVLRRAIRSVNPELHDPTQAPTEYEAVKSLLEFTPDREPPQIPLDNFNTKAADTRLIALSFSSLNPLDEYQNKIDLASEFRRYGTDAVTRFTPKSRSLAANRGFWRVDSGKIKTVTQEEVLASHLIDNDAHEALTRSDFDGFIKIRQRAISELVNQFLDSRLEPGSKIRPPLRQMAFEDDQ
jgi:hypothetical protein